MRGMQSDPRLFNNDLSKQNDYSYKCCQKKKKKRLKIYSYSVDVTYKK